MTDDALAKEMVVDCLDGGEEVGSAVGGMLGVKRDDVVS
jgi:hypothetical protein